MEALASQAQPKGRLIKRKLSLQAAFHQIDMMGVAHNSVYFLWFEQGRLQIMLEVLPWEMTQQLGVVMPVVENRCHYRKPVRFGDPLLLYTTHRVQPAYQGRLTFHHYLIHQRQRAALACGQTVTTLVETRSQRLVKQWPQKIWDRYQALR
jgi:acyl-CoA thioester hydrolase